jgi:hypothetical protein
MPATPVMMIAAPSRRSGPRGSPNSGTPKPKTGISSVRGMTVLTSWRWSSQYHVP